MRKLTAEDKILITGSAGFIGTHLVKKLKNRYSIHEFDILLDSSMDILNREAVEAYVNEVRPGTVIHLAANPSVQHAERDPVYDLLTNTV